MIKPILVGLALAALAMVPNSNAGYYSITYSVTGSSSTGATPNGPYFTVYVSDKPSGTLSATETVQATYTWVSSEVGDNPPSEIQVQEYVTCGVDVSGSNLGNVVLSDPFNDPITSDSDTPTYIYEFRETNPGGSGHYYIQNSPGASFSSPARTISGSVAGTDYSGEVFLNYQATTYEP